MKQPFGFRFKAGYFRKHGRQLPQVWIRRQKNQISADQRTMKQKSFDDYASANTRSDYAMTRPID